MCSAAFLSGVKVMLMLQLLPGTPTLRMPKDSDKFHLKIVAAPGLYRTQYACLLLFGGYIH